MAAQVPRKFPIVALVQMATAHAPGAFLLRRHYQEAKMQATARRLSRWATIGAAAAVLIGLASAAQARPWHGWWRGHYWGPSYVTVAPYYRPYYRPYYYAPYYAPPPVTYSYPTYGYPTYTPYAYAAPGPSFNFTVPLP
jgi:hypothetical protein